MKKVMLSLVLLPYFMYAQKVKWDNDTIYKDNKPYALLIKTDGLQPGFSLRTLTNVEIAVASNDATVPVNPATKMGYYRVTFSGSGQVAHFPATQPIGKRIAKAAVENDLVSETGVSPDGEKRFIALYPSQVQQSTTVIVNTGPSYNMVERNRKSSVSENNGTIRQDNVEIGNCSSTTSTTKGKIYTTVSFTLPGGVKCAEATFEGATGKTCTIVTLKDNRTHTLTVKNTAMKEKEIAEYLVNNYYL